MANNDYNASSITVLEGLEAVRKRPGMYIGSVDYRGVNHLMYEIVDNAVDEHLAGFCNRIEVTIHADGSATVKDNGRGVPVDLHQKGVSAERVIFTTLHAGGKFDSQSYQVSGGLHGVGSSVVNALSSWLTVKSSVGGKVYYDRYRQGHPDQELTGGMIPQIGKAKQSGTEISFLPDSEIFGHHSFKASSIKSRLHQTAYLNPNLTIHFVNERPGEEENTELYEPEGIRGYMKDLNEGKECVTGIIAFSGKEEGIEVDVCLQFTRTFEENILGYCNNIYTAEGGLHLTGFKNRFTAILNSYARELGVLKDKDENFTGADTRNGMTAIISIRHPDPMFEGQTKTKLGSADAARAVAAVTAEQLPVYLDKNLEELKEMLKCASRSATVRKNQLKNKENMLSKNKYSFDSNGKLANCESNDASKCEIFIVEGDSAGGSAKTARNRRYQAILPIRGKILNVEKATMDKVLANAEIKTMINAFGCGFSEGLGNDFDITKLRYGKIIIMADADVDGAHISTLLMTFFYRFMPELIQEGHVYLAMPPLYKTIPARGESEYLYDDDALAKYRKNHKNFKLQRYKGLGEMDAEQLWETTMNPETRLLKQIGIDDAQAADRLTSLLMGTEVEPRRNYIQQNAKYATLDV